MKHLLYCLFLLSLSSCSSTKENKDCVKTPDEFKENYQYLWKYQGGGFEKYCGDINQYYTFGETLLSDAVWFGKNFVFIEECLKRGGNIFLKSNNHFQRSASEWVAFPSFFDPHILKNQEDIFKILELFIKYYPTKKKEIYRDAYYTLITYNSPVENDKIFIFLYNEVKNNNSYFFEDVSKNDKNYIAAFKKWRHYLPTPPQSEDILQDN